MQEIFAQAAAALSRGQILESQATATGLAAAVRCYDEAITLLRKLPASAEPVRRELARATMNRGNALQQQPVAAFLADAVRAYDESIALFRSLPIDQNPEDRNSLGAAWMNRGHALYQQATRPSFIEAARSQLEAIDTLKPLSIDEARAYRLNLAASWLNLANTLLALGETGRALEASGEAIRLAAPGEDSDPALADIGLKARRARCEALSRELIMSLDTNQPTEPFVDEASDVVDEGLSLARTWESRGLPLFRPIAARLFRFGAQLYGAYLPDFLAEFVLEHLDPARSTGAMPMVDDSFQAASEAITRARADLEGRRTVFLDTPETARLLQRLRDLREAEARLAELRREHGSSGAAST